MRWGLVGGGRGVEVLVWRVFCLRGLFYHFRGVRNGAGDNENGKPGGWTYRERNKQNYWKRNKQNYYIF